MTLLTMNSQDYRFLHRLWKSLSDWGILTSAHTGILTASRQLAASDWVEAISRLLLDEDDLTGRLFTWDVQNSQWHLDRF